jgi:hypothetical protein
VTLGAERLDLRGKFIVDLEHLAHSVEMGTTEPHCQPARNRRSSVSARSGSSR